MQYKIFGDNLPAVTITMDSGEGMYTQSGGMSWMQGDIEMKTNAKGGLKKSLGRMFSGESFFLVNYISKQNGSEVTFASSFPGNIVPFDINQGNIIAQKTAFLCAENTVNLSVHFTKRFSSGLFGGEGFILQKLSGSGMAFLELDGSCKEIELSAGESIKVDTGHVAAFEECVKYEIETIKGVKNIFFGGEGLFLTKLTGPGRVWLQTMTIQGFAGRIIPFIPSSPRK